MTWMMGVSFLLFMPAVFLFALTLWDRAHAEREPKAVRVMSRRRNNPAVPRRLFWRR